MIDDVMAEAALIAPLAMEAFESTGYADPAYARAAADALETGVKVATDRLLARYPNSDRSFVQFALGWCTLSVAMTVGPDRPSPPAPPETH